MCAIFRTKVPDTRTTRCVRFAFFDRAQSSSLICNPNSPHRKRTRSMRLPPSPLRHPKRGAEIILSVHSPFSKVRMGRGVRATGHFDFQSETDERTRTARRGGKREEVRVYERGSHFALWPRKSASRPCASRVVRESSARARMRLHRRISVLLWLHFRLFVVREGTWQLAVHT